MNKSSPIRQQYLIFPSVNFHSLCPLMIFLMKHLIMVLSLLRSQVFMFQRIGETSVSFEAGYINAL